MEPPDRGDPGREDPRRPLSAGNQRHSGADSQHGGLEPLQESLGGGGCFLPSQRLFTSAAGVSLATRSGSQPCAHLFPGLLVERQTGTAVAAEGADHRGPQSDRKSTRLNSSHTVISYAVFCLKKKKKKKKTSI